jgi:hypothetical protein
VHPAWFKFETWCVVGPDAFDHELLNEVRPKLHYFAHLLLELVVTFENPRRQDLFSAEDYIGKIKRIGSMCHRSVVGLRVVQRLSNLLCLRWHLANDASAETHAV